jgi:chitinase
LLSTNANIISLRAVAADLVEVGSIANRPQVLTGLISFKLGLLSGETSADVTVYLTEPAPDGAMWYKYDLEQGWVPFSNVTFAGDRKSVTIHLTDGGVGDDDGVQNGVIVDPSGLGYSANGGGYGISDSSTSSADAGGGCFIATSASDTSGHAGYAQLILLLVSLIGIAVMMGSEDRK